MNCKEELSPPIPTFNEYSPQGIPWRHIGEWYNEQNKKRFVKVTIASNCWIAIEIPQGCEWLTNKEIGEYIDNNYYVEGDCIVKRN